jgi:hypothetical protein
VVVALPPDLAQVTPADLAHAATADLAMPPPPRDLAMPPPPRDLATPPPPPDLATPRPPTVGLSGEFDTALHPVHAEGTLYRDGCPAGQAIMGFVLQVPTDGSGAAAGVYRVDPICARPTVSAAAGGGWTVGWTRGNVVTGHGIAGALTVEYACPANQVIVGYSGRSGDYLDQMSISCAPVTIAANRSVTVGPIVDSSNHVGGTGGSPFGPVYCPTGQVTTLVRVYVPDDFPFVGFGLGCSTVTAL